MNDALIRGVLADTRTIAVVGVSDKPERASYQVAQFLIEHTAYDVVLVNPRVPSLFERQVFASLAELPVLPDLVDVFRNIEELPAITDEAIGVGARSLWFQLGLTHDQAAAHATEAGLRVVQNACLKVEIQRFGLPS